jgi:hypothetical protein
LFEADVTLFLSDKGLDPRCPVIDRAQLGGGARVFDWRTYGWHPFSKTTRVLIPMTIMNRNAATVMAHVLTNIGGFRGGSIIVYQTDPPEAVSYADIMADYKMVKRGKKRRPYIPSDQVYMGLVYTRIAEWREMLSPLVMTPADCKTTKTSAA